MANREFFSTYHKIIDDKWVKLTIFSVALLFASNVFYGWQQFQLLLAKGGAYVWLCPDGYDFEAEGNQMCDAQLKAVEKLYTIAAGFEYLSSIIGGSCLDHLGPRESGLIGASLSLIGNLLLLFSSPTFNAYIPAMVFLGLSGNTISYPAFVLGEIFPGFNAIAGAFNIAGQAACTVIAPIMWCISQAHPDWTFFDLQLGYLLICWLPVVFIYMLALPNKRETQKKLEAIKKEIEEIEKKRNIAQIEGGEILATPQVTSKMDEVDEVDSSNTTVDENAIKVEAKQSTLNYAVDIISEVYEPVKKDSGDISSQPSPPPDLIKGIHEDSVYEKDMAIKEKASLRQVLRDMKTREFILFGIFYPINVLQSAYFFANILPALGDDISHFVGYFMPTQAIWAILGGMLLEFLGTAATMHILALGTGVCLAICAIPGCPKALQYVSTIWMVMQDPVIFTDKFSIVSEVFEKYHFGKLVGCYGVLGGLITFVNIPISESTDYKLWYSVFAAFAIPLLGIATYLLVRQRSGAVQYRLNPQETRVPWSLRVGKPELTRSPSRLSRLNSRERIGSIVSKN